MRIIGPPLKSGDVQHSEIATKRNDSLAQGGVTSHPVLLDAQVIQQLDHKIIPICKR